MRVGLTTVTRPGSSIDAIFEIRAPRTKGRPDGQPNPAEIGLQPRAVGYGYQRSLCRGLEELDQPLPQLLRRPDPPRRRVPRRRLYRCRAHCAEFRRQLDWKVLIQLEPHAGLIGTSFSSCAEFRRIVQRGFDVLRPKRWVALSGSLRSWRPPARLSRITVTGILVPVCTDLTGAHIRLTAQYVLPGRRPSLQFTRRSAALHRGGFPPILPIDILQPKSGSSARTPRRAEAQQAAGRKACPHNYLKLHQKDEPRSSWKVRQRRLFGRT